MAAEIFIICFECLDTVSSTYQIDHGSCNNNFAYMYSKLVTLAIDNSHFTSAFYLIYL